MLDRLTCAQSASLTAALHAPGFIYFGPFGAIVPIGGSAPSACASTRHFLMNPSFAHVQQTGLLVLPMMANELTKNEDGNSGSAIPH